MNGSYFICSCSKDILIILCVYCGHDTILKVVRRPIFYIIFMAKVENNVYFDTVFIVKWGF